MTSHPYLLDIEGLFTQGWRPGRIVGKTVGGILKMDSSDWSNGIRYRIVFTRPDTEVKRLRGTNLGTHDKTAGRLSFNGRLAVEFFRDEWPGQGGGSDECVRVHWYTRCEHIVRLS